MSYTFINFYGLDNVQYQSVNLSHIISLTNDQLISLKKRVSEDENLHFKIKLFVANFSLLSHLFLF